MKKLIFNFKSKDAKKLKFPKFISDISGRGLFIGIDLIKKGNPLIPNSILAKNLINHLRHKGILLSTDGPYDNVIKIKPPLVFNKKNVDTVCKNLDIFFKKI